MIPVRALLDMWIELYEEVKDDMGALTKVLGLTDRHLAELVYKGYAEYLYLFLFS